MFLQSVFRHLLLSIGMFGLAFSVPQSTSAQYQLTKRTSVYDVRDVLAENPAGNKTSVSGLAIRVSAHQSYSITVEFTNTGSTMRPVYQRVKLYEATPLTENCATQVCWKPLAQFSSNDVHGKTIIKKPTFQSFLITVWETGPGMNRSGAASTSLVESADNVEEITVGEKRGLKITFGSIVVVNILNL